MANSILRFYSRDEGLSTWPVTSSLYPALRSSYGSQLIAELFGSGLQSFQALLLVPLFVCRNPFVYVGLSPAEQAVNQCGDLSGCGKGSDVCPFPLCYITVVRPQGGVAIA